jgi:hypothetical protein
VTNAGIQFLGARGAARWCIGEQSHRWTRATSRWRPHKPLRLGFAPGSSSAWTVLSFP